jgi:hypothetical protein
MVQFPIWMIFVSIPVMAIIDSVLFSRWLVCGKCGATPTWKDFILPCTLETSLFLAGIAIGVMM